MIRSLIHINWKPTRRDLVVFGIAGLLFSILLSLLLMHLKNLSNGAAATIITVGAWFMLICIFLPVPARLIYLAFSLIAMPIGIVVSFTVLALFYYCLLTPVGLLMRLFGRDVLKLKEHPSQKSYWQPYREHSDMKRYFHQF